MDPKVNRKKGAWFGKMNRRLSVGHMRMKGQYNSIVQYQIQDGGGLTHHGKQINDRLVKLYYFHTTS